MTGERSVLPDSLQNKMKQVEAASKGMETKARLEFIVFAICYSGTIVEATRSLCENVKAGIIEPDAIDETSFEQELLTHGTPPPDLCIRTGGHLHLSDYLTWQFAQTELYFTDINGPDFTEVEFSNSKGCGALAGDLI